MLKQTYKYLTQYPANLYHSNDKSDMQNKQFDIFTVMHCSI